MKKETGFSLIEVLVVVAIIGILTLIALPNYKNYVMRVRITELINDASDYVSEQQIAAASVADYYGASPSMRSLINDGTLRPDQIAYGHKCVNGFKSVYIEYKDKKKEDGSARRVVTGTTATCGIWSVLGSTSRWTTPRKQFLHIAATIIYRRMVLLLTSLLT